MDAQFTSDIVLKYIIIFGKDFGPSNLDYRIRSASKLFTKIPKWSIDSPDTDDFLSYSLFSEEDKIGLSYVMRLLSDTLNEFVHNQPTTEFDFSCSRNQYHTLPLSYRSGVIAANLNFDTALNVESYYRLLIQLFFLLWGTSVLGTVCREKANKSREFLRLMGASRLIIYASHFALFFIVMLTCLTLGLFIVFRHTFDRLIPIPIFFTILMLSITLFILFCFLISIFFNNTTWASLTFLLVNFCFTATIYEQFRHYFFIYLFLLLNPLNLVSVMWEMAYSFELRQLTLQQLLFEKHKMQHNLSLFEMTLYGSLVNVLYIFLIFYVDNVWPFQHGVPKPFFFLVDPNYWTCTQSMETNEECDQLIQTGDKFEKNTSAPIICVRQVEKGFYTRYRAFGFRKVIKKLSMDVCSNQLTVLLGFNGAGKTTLMDMITGNYLPTLFFLRLSLM